MAARFAILICRKRYWDLRDGYRKLKVSRDSGYSFLVEMMNRDLCPMSEQEVIFLRGRRGQPPMVDLEE